VPADATLHAMGVHALCAQRAAQVWALVGYSLLRTLRGHTDAVVCLAFDLNLLFSGSEDATIRVWETVGVAPLGAATATSLATAAATASTTAATGFAASASRRVQQGPSASGGFGAAALGGPAAASRVTGGVNSSSSGAASSLSGGASTLSVGSALHVLRGHSRCVTGLEVDNTRGVLLSCSLDGSVRVWDYAAGTCLAKFVHQVCF
jgi:F-box/WD-40 domain protein MET30